MTDVFLLNVAATMSHSRANGPGVRAVIWVQGCTIGCPGCYNSYTHKHKKVSLVEPREIVEWILSIEGIEGITFSGGEPFEQAAGVLETIQLLKSHNSDLSVFIFTGYELDALEKASDQHVRDLVNNIDVLSSGPYISKLRSQELLWRGSTNQQLSFLSSRYNEETELNKWETESPVEEYLLQNTQLHFSGFGGPGSSILKELKSSLHISTN